MTSSSMTTSMASGIEAQNTLEANPDSLPSHLGGHMDRTHNDRGTLTFLINQYNIKTFLDIGCGPGGMVELAQMRGLDAVGVDGDWTVERPKDVRVMIHDYTVGPTQWTRQFDLGWSVEFLEHVEEKYQDNYMQDFARCKYVVTTAAPPNYPGHHHVNCREQEYWHAVFDKYGFDYDDEVTRRIRTQESTMHKPFMQTTGMFFRRRT
jgi:SAM-dependent methyltransferase